MQQNHNNSISIITPSFNMLPYLKLATASIGDQETDGGGVQHIIIDGASTDGTADWLASHPYPNLKSISEPDNGMYDAINKGLKQADGDILAYLNCDEQYLPGTLGFVNRYFKENPQVDIIFGDALLTRPDGTLIAFRKGYRPRYNYIMASHLYVLSCTMFFRRRIIEAGHFFDTQYRCVGDMEFVLRLLKQGYRATHIKRYFSLFTMTGQNLSSDERAVTEQKELMSQAPLYLRVAKPFFNIFRLTAKLFSGAYNQGGPITYQIYTGEDATQRKTFSVEKASSKWSVDPATSPQK